jgi:hypothetical protein
MQVNTNEKIAIGLPVTSVYDSLKCQNQLNTEGQIFDNICLIIQQVILHALDG